MEATDVPVNYRGDGTWHFEAELSSGHWELDVTPHLYLYKMLPPDGKWIEGTIPTLLTRAENHHQDPELAEWILHALSWDYRNNNYQDWKKREKFVVDGRTYEMSCNPRTGAVELYFDRKVMIGPRSDFATVNPEIYGIKQGQLSELITSVIADKIEKFKKTPSKVDFTVEFDDIRAFEIDGWTVQIGYDNLLDQLMVDLDARVEHTHVSTFDQDVWEVKWLHDGKYREELIGVLADHGFMDVQL